MRFYIAASLLLLICYEIVRRLDTRQTGPAEGFFWIAIAAICAASSLASIVASMLPKQGRH